MKLAFAAAIALASSSVASEAYAELRKEKKILQFGGPETRTRCIGNLKTKGAPACHFEGIKIYCHDTWIETCTEWATDLKQHEFFLVARGPEVGPGLREGAQRALEQSLAAAVVAAASTPGEAGAKFTAGLAAFKIAIEATMTGELKAIRDRCHLNLDERGHW
jgi:hypothetical protein